MALYRYSTRERLTYPTKVPFLSDKQVEKTNAEVKCAQEEQVQRTYARRKSTDWKVCRWTWTCKGSQTFLKAFFQESSAFYTQLSLHICTSTPRLNVRTGRSIQVTYTSRDNYVWHHYSQSTYIWHHCSQKQNRQIKIHQMELETDPPNYIPAEFYGHTVFVECYL